MDMHAHGAESTQPGFDGIPNHDFAPRLLRHLQFETELTPWDYSPLQPTKVPVSGILLGIMRSR